MIWGLDNRGCADLFKGVILFAVATLGRCTDNEVLQCYKCSVTVEKYFINNTTVVTPLCSKFEETSSYMTNCPYSTMCLKTISTLHLQNGQKQETVTRGCAQQKNTTQVFRNKQWEQEHLVQEVYKEGCSEVQSNNLAGSINVHCYCRGNLCNSANSFNFNKPFLIIITLINAITLLNVAYHL